MRQLLKHFVINTISLYIVSVVVSGIFFQNGIETLLIAGVFLALTTLIVRPVINVLLLPINLVTFSLFKWVGYAVALYLVTLVVPGFKLTEFWFKGYSSAWATLPTLHFEGLLSFVIFSLVISSVSSLLYWLFK